MFVCWIYPCTCLGLPLITRDRDERNRPHRQKKKSVWAIWFLTYKTPVFTHISCRQSQSSGLCENWLILQKPAFFFSFFSCFISSVGFKRMCAVFMSPPFCQCSVRANDSQYLSHNAYRRKSASVGLSWMWARLNGSCNCLPIHLIGIHMALCMVQTRLCFHSPVVLLKAAGRLSYGCGIWGIAQNKDLKYSIYTWPHKSLDTTEFCMILQSQKN